ncbi:uncharacterized protein PG998_006704 [Apiospora kogelbergensis]|uniref:uncharacterized protein n=1 Tax=Apiospora kogelbergensis TaxID=1337665 RepID=UPI00312CC742
MTEGFLVEGPDWNTVATPLGAGGDRPEDWRLLSAACGYTVDCVPRPAYATGAVKYALHWLKDFHHNPPVIEDRIRRQLCPIHPQARHPNAVFSARLRGGRFLDIGRVVADPRAAQIQNAAAAGQHGVVVRAQRRDGGVVDVGHESRRVVERRVRPGVLSREVGGAVRPRGVPRRVGRVFQVGPGGDGVSVWDAGMLEYGFRW